MRRADQLVDAYYSPQVEALKRQSRQALTIAMVLGALAVGLFALFGVTLFGSIMFGFSTITIILLILLVPVVIALVIGSWVAAFRFFWSAQKAKSAVDDHMRQHITENP